MKKFSNDRSDESKRLFSNKVHTGHPDCCADCELMYSSRGLKTPFQDAMLDAMRADADSKGQKKDVYDHLASGGKPIQNYDELMEVIREAHRSSFSAAGIRPPKRSWFISYAWSAYNAGQKESKTGYGNVFHNKHDGLGLSQSDIKEVEEFLKEEHRPYTRSPEDKVTIVILNIVEIDPE